MNKNELLKKIALSIEKGKVSLMSPHPPEMEGEKGTDELTREALDSGIPAKEILSNGLIIGGVPVITSFAAKIGADAYFPGPQGTLDFFKYSL